MDDKRISELTAYTRPLYTDLLPLVDLATSTTKRIMLGNALGLRNAANYGSEDTDAVIQAAIDDLPAGGGAVYVPGREWTFNTGLSLPSNILLFGDGPATVFKAGAAVTVLTNDTQSGDGNSNIHLQDFKIDGGEVMNYGVNFCQAGIRFY